ncbi:MAG: hypothetical protein GXC72_00770 [Chitinophagaceae bacterium]|nr:hypothetical protein [Chitinophagaceae bacterium]
MNLKNYTSSVPAATSILRICKALVEAGATDISQKYDPETKTCIAISFRLVITGQVPMFFQLPAKVDPCFNVLWNEVKRPRADSRKKIMEQAERTAWKIVADWVEIQLSMILLEQAEPLQVFLPYVYDPVKQRTFYQSLKDVNFRGLLT